MTLFLPQTIFDFLFNRRRSLLFAGSAAALFLGTTSYAQNPADLCASAVTITPTLVNTPTAYTLPGSYGYEGTSPSCMSGFNLDDAWYSFTAQTNNYTFVASGNASHTVAVYSGTCGALVPINCDFAGSGANATITFTVTPSTLYYIQIQRNSGITTTTMTGNFSLYYATAPGGVKTAMKAWYKPGANVIRTGTNVTQWNTEIGNVNFTNVYNAPQYGTAVANFNPGVTFDGDSYLYNNNTLGGDLIAANNNTVLFVCKPNTGGILLKWDQNQTVNRYGFEANYSTPTIRIDHPGDPYSKPGPGRGQWNIVTAETSPTIDFFSLNGVIASSGIGGTNDITLSGRFSLGGNTWSSHSCNMDFTEAVYYGATLTANEVRKVQSYFAVKYGITLGTNANPVDYLSSTGVITWPMNSTDQNDIAGIARDDAAGLSQLKSKSINTDDIVTMALVDGGGSFAAPNAFDNDLEFELWGNDNGGQPSTVLSGGLVESTFEMPTSVLKRLLRQWHVEETGTVGDVALTFDLNGIPITGTTFYDLRLLIDLDKDGDFTTGTVKRITPSSYSGGIVTFNNVDFNDGEIFTLATLVPSPGGVSSGLQIWLRADQLTSTTTNGAQLNSWYNAGSSNFDFRRIAGSTVGWPKFRTKAINYNHAIEFGSLGAMISEDNAIYMRPTINNSTSMVVFRSSQTTSNTDFTKCPSFVTTESYYTGRDYGFGMQGGRMGLKIKDGDIWDATSNNFYNENITHLASAFRTRSGFVNTPSTVSLQVDGLTDVTTTTAGNSYPLDASDASGSPYKGTGIGGMTVTGWDVYATMQFTGFIPEIIVYNNVISGVNLNKVNSYLAMKYGLTLGDNTTSVSYINSSAAVVWNASSTHQHDILAIGRDDRSQLDQRRSASVEVDNMLDVALVDNGGTQANPNAFDNDLEFFITGNNNGARAFNTADVDGTIMLNRLSRVWKVQETGTVGNLVVAVDLTSIVTPIVGTDLRLMIDRDNDGFADNDVAPKSADSYNSGTKIAYFTADFNSGDLFTVGTAAAALPVEFIGIKAVAESDKNKVTWQTATELNNSHFVIERLVNGQTWDSIGFQPSTYTASGIHSYEFLDNNVSTLPFAYYRVVQYDYDGKFAYSKIVYVDRSTLNSTLIKIGPNPSDGNIGITINNELFTTNTYRLAVYSILGIKVFDGELREPISRIDLSSLPSGNYVIELINSAGTAPIYENIIIKRQ